MNLYIYNVNGTSNYNIYLSLPPYHTCDIELTSSGQSAVLNYKDVRTGFPSSNTETRVNDILGATQYGIMYIHINGAVEISGQQLLTQNNLTNSVYEASTLKAITPLGVRTFFENTYNTVYSKVVNAGTSDFWNVTSNLLVKVSTDDSEVAGMIKLLEQYDFRYTQYAIAQNSTVWIERPPLEDISPRIQYLSSQTINGQFYHKYQYAVQVSSYAFQRVIRVYIKRIAL
jgi:hypothetical protein